MHENDFFHLNKIDEQMEVQAKSGLGQALYSYGKDMYQYYKIESEKT